MLTSIIKILKDNPVLVALAGLFAALNTFSGILKGIANPVLSDLASFVIATAVIGAAASPIYHAKMDQIRYINRTFTTKRPQRVFAALLPSVFLIFSILAADAAFHWSLLRHVAILPEGHWQICGNLKAKCLATNSCAELVDASARPVLDRCVRPVDDAHLIRLRSPSWLHYRPTYARTICPNEATAMRVVIPEAAFQGTCDAVIGN